MKKTELPMSVARASAIALGSPTGCLGDPQKMPGPSFGISAMKCRRGSVLAKNPRSVCAHCYGRHNLYLYPNVTDAHAKRLAGFKHPLWVEAMVVLITRYVKPAIPFFRWFDAGDLQGIGMLRQIIEVCRRTPGVRHFLPTHEPYIVRDYLRLVAQGKAAALPPNLCIRISADFVGKPPKQIKGLEHFPTSTVHRGHGATHRIMVSEKQNDSIECRAYTRGKKRDGSGRCGTCRACWKRRVRNISFSFHGEQPRDYSDLLPFGVNIGKENQDRPQRSYVGKRTYTRARRRAIRNCQYQLFK